MEYSTAIKHNMMLAILALMVMGIPGLASAETGSLSVQPSAEAVQVESGKTVRKSLLVVNGEDKPVTLKIFIKDATVIDENGKVDLFIASNLQSAVNWLVPQYTSITIPPLSSGRMDYLVVAEKDMESKGYTGAIAFSRYDTKTKKIFGEPFGMLVHMNIVGQGITTGGTINSTTTTFLQFKDPVEFGFKVNNPSNSNLTLSGNIVFTDILGRKAGEFNAGELTILPGATRKFNFSWSNASLFGVYKGEISLQNSMVKDHVIQKSVWFIFFPWQKTWPPVVVLLVVIGFIIYMRRQYAVQQNIVSV